MRMEENLRLIPTILFSMSATAVCQQMEVWVGSTFNWVAAGTGSFQRWATDKKDKGVSDFSAGGLCCFYFPLLCAYLTKDLTREEIGDLIFDQMSSGISQSPPLGWCPSGVNKYNGAKTPLPRGSVVFFSAKGAPYFAHVAVATGEGSTTVSFGHDAPYLQGGLIPLQVARLTVDEIKKINKGLTDVHFGVPCW